MDSNKIDVPPTYEEATAAKNCCKPSAGQPLDKKIETNRGNVVIRMDLEDELGNLRPCCAGCCGCGYQCGTMAIGIICLVLACLDLMINFFILGSMAFSSYEFRGILDWKLSRASIVPVTLLGVLIDIFNIIINVLLIVGVKTKNREYVIYWLCGYILNSCLAYAVSIWFLFAWMISISIVELLWGGILCDFIRIVWKYQKSIGPSVV